MRLFALIILFLGFTACTSSGKKEQATKVDKSQVTAAKKAEAKADKKENLERYTCVVGKDKRLVEIDRSTKGRCEVHYTKLGDENSVAWAQATPSICTEVFGRIRTNIESAGFECTPKDSPKEAQR